MQSLSLLSLLVTLFSIFGLSFAKVPHQHGWKLIWHDDFSGRPHSLPNHKKWKIDIGHGYPGGSVNWGTGEIQYYTRHKKNVHIANNMLWITPTKNSDGSWSSGRIETHRGNFKARAGHRMKIQARISIPNVDNANGLGYWPAFWTMGSNFRGNYTNWPSCGELDIMENVNGVPSTSATMHCGVTPGGYCNEPIGLGNRGACKGSNCNGNWHTYSVTVDRRHGKPESVTFKVDGAVRNQIFANQMDAQTWSRALHHGHYIILNVAMGGQYPDGYSSDGGGTGSTPTGSTVSGKSMKVKYVAVYEH